MRVLILSHGHPAFSIGGAEIASHNLFRGLQQIEGCESFYLARATPPIRRHGHTPLMSLRQSRHELFLHADDYDHFWLSNRATEDIEGHLRGYLEAVRPEVVHFHHVLGLGVETLFEVRRTLPDAVICVTFHEYLSICLNHGQMVKTSRNRLCSRASPADCGICFPDIAPAEIFKRELFIKNHLGLADCFISPSRFLIDRYAAWGIARDRLRLLENGLEPFQPAPPRELPAGGRRSRFGFFGQITEFKGMHVLLDAVTRVPEEVWGDDSALCVFGGNLENQPEAFQAGFRQLMDKAGRRAKFYGSYSAPDLPGLIRQVDWVVVPSIWWENSPLVIQEAFAHGRPVICSDIGGMAEKVRDGVDGLHFRVGSPEHLADRLAQALTEPGLWDRLHANAPRPLDLHDAAREHHALYASLLQQRRAAGRGRRTRRAGRARAA